MEEFAKFKHYADTHFNCWTVDKEERVPMLRAGFATWLENAPTDMEDDEDKFLAHFMYVCPFCSGTVVDAEVNILQPEVENVTPEVSEQEWNYILHCFENEVNSGNAPIRVENDGRKYAFVFRNWDTGNPNYKTYEQIIRRALTNLENDPSLLD
jgi:hypothetical protein